MCLKSKYYLYSFHYVVFSQYSDCGTLYIIMVKYIWNDINYIYIFKMISISRHSISIVKATLFPDIEHACSYNSFRNGFSIMLN